MVTQRSGRIVLQMAAIIGIGFAIGLVDVFIVRPVDLSKRETPKGTIGDLLPATGGHAGTATVRPPEPSNGHPPAQSQDTSKPPDHARPSETGGASSSPSPAPTGTAGGATAFVPTKKSDLPEGQITLVEAKQAFDAGAMFVDARKVEDFAAGHVENAIRIESDMFRHGDPPALGLIPRSAVVVVYCNGGHCDESENVAKFLSNSGYGKVFVMHDGFPGWKAVGYPFATGE